MSFFSKLFKDKKNQDQRTTYEVCHNENLLNSMDTVFANIRFSSVDEDIRAVAVASSTPNDGKTTVAVTLAVVMSRIGKKTLLIEGDMRRRSLRSVLGVKAPYGIYSVLKGDVSIDEAVVATKDSDLFFLDAEAGLPNPEELLNSKRYVDLIEQLKAKFDYIVIDTPPLGAFADAVHTASHVDGTILVVREGYTEKRSAQYMVELLKSINARILGVVINCKKSSMNSGSGYGYGYYYDYYYEDKEVPLSSVDPARLKEIQKPAADTDEQAAQA